MKTKVSLALLSAVATAAVSVAVANSTTALFMTGTQGCGLPTRPTCAAESVFTPAQMQQIADIYPPLFGGATLTAVGTPELLWPLTGLTSETLAKSVAQGTANLDAAIKATPGQKVVFGGSQSALIVAQEKQNLLTGPNAPPASDLQFIVVGNPVRPNGGIFTRFPWLQQIPLIGLGPTTAPPDTPYNTIDIANQYDGVADFPTYPLNLVADANAIMGLAYEHGNVAQYSTVASTPPQNITTVTNSLGGTTTYYLIPTPNLPLLQPLRQLGVPKAIVDPLNKALTPIVEAGYNRSASQVGVVTPARLVPKIATPIGKAIHDNLVAVRNNHLPTRNVEHLVRASGSKHNQG